MNTAILITVGFIFVFLVSANFLALLRYLLKSDKDKFWKGSLRSRTALKIFGSFEDNIIFLTFCVCLLVWAGYVFGLEALLKIEFTVKYAEVLNVLIFLFVIGFVTVLFILAKAFAALFPEKTLRNLAIPLYIILLITTPIRIPLIWLTKRIIKLFHLQPLAIDLKHKNKSAEFAKLVRDKEKAGDFDKEDEQMLKGVIGLSNTVAREIMTPRTELIVVQLHDTLEDVCKIIKENGFSRYPVIDKSVDNVVGIFLAKDLMPYLKGYCEAVSENVGQFSVSQIMRQPYFITENKRVDDLLAEFKTKKLHIAIVLDEYGGVDGIVTLEDLLEEIVGDIFDESDDFEKEIVEKDGKIIVDGGVLVCDLNAEYRFGIPEHEGYDTIAGFLYNALGRVPQNGDFVEIENGGIVLKSGMEAKTKKEGAESDLKVERYRMTVKNVDDFKIEEVEIVKIVNP